MLKLSYDAKSDIPEGLEKFYVEKDGVFTIQVEGMKTDQDVKSVQTALQKERETRRDAEKKLERFALLPDDFNIDEYNALKDQGGGKIEEKLAEQAKRLNDQFAKERDNLKKDLEAKDNLVNKHVKEAALERGLAEINVGKQFAPAVRSMFKEQMTINGEDVYLNDRPVKDFLTEWSKSDEGKHFVTAPNNSGGGTDKTGSKENNDNSKSMSRAEFRELSPAEQSKFSKEGGSLTND